MQNPAELLATARNSFNAGTTKPLAFREKQLKNLIRLYEENTPILLEALKDDLNKSKQEGLIFEIELLKNEALNMIYNLSDWTKPEFVDKDITTLLDTPKILPEPYGVVLIIGAWNYPLALSLGPLTGAIAAGNCAVLKPSELAPASAKVMAELLPKYLDSNCFKVFLGGPAETQQLLEHKFDYIFYTGSPRVGAIIAQSAAKYLTPTTLELGGKSPCYLDSTVNIDIAAARILWGKLSNAGQTCIAPDYILCSPDIETKFIDAFKRVLKKQYGADMKATPDYSRIINSAHFNRIVKLLEGQEIAHGGSHDISQRYIEPTICINVDINSPIMKEEIFGPVLPIVRVNSAYEAINFINAREKPLSLYVFSNDKTIVNLFEQDTSSGGVCVNDTLMQFACDALPFGGVGQSGVGAYHGKFSFDTFSHKKPILERSINKLGEMLLDGRYAPFSDGKIKTMSLLIKKRQLPVPKQRLGQIFLIAVGVVAGYCWSIMAMQEPNC